MYCTVHKDSPGTSTGGVWKDNQKTDGDLERSRGHHLCQRRRHQVSRKTKINITQGSEPQHVAEQFLHNHTIVSLLLLQAGAAGRQTG